MFPPVVIDAYPDSAVFISKHVYANVLNTFNIMVLNICAKKPCFHKNSFERFGNHLIRVHFEMITADLGVAEKTQMHLGES